MSILENDDIRGIQALYGRPGNKPTSRPKPRPTRRPDTEFPDTAIGSNNRGLCDEGPIDDIVKTKDGNYYVFKGTNYWKLTEDSVADGYPRKISQGWPGLPNDIDAATTIGFYDGM